MRKEKSEPEPRTKKFRGAMDIFFKSGSGPAPEAAPPKASLASSSASLTPTPPPKSAPPPSSVATSPPVAMPAASGNSAPSASSTGSGVGLTPKASPPEAPAALAPEPPMPPPSEQIVLRSMTEPFACEVFLLDSQPPTLHIKNMCQENKRFSANLMLKSWKGGTFTNDNFGHRHQRERRATLGRSVVFFTRLEDRKLWAAGGGFLAGATSVYGYESFAAGACGSALKQKSGKPVFLTTGEVEIRKRMEACKAAASVHMLWSFTFAATQQQFQPKGLVLVSKKVVNVPAGQQKQF